MEGALGVFESGVGRVGRCGALSDFAKSVGFVFSCSLPEVFLELIMEEAEEAREELKLFLLPSSAFTWLGLLGRLGLFSARGGSGLLATGFSPPPTRDLLLVSSWTLPPDLLKACSCSAGFTGGGCFSGKTPDLLFACFLLSSSNQLGLASEAGEDS